MARHDEAHNRAISEAKKAQWADPEFKRRQLEARLAKRAAITEKHCPRCSTTKPASEFKRRPSGGLDSYCIPCERTYNAERQRRYFAAHPEYREKQKHANRKTTLKRGYSMTPEQYAEMLAAQGGKCAICRAEQPGSKKLNFPVDHCHKTGAVRGLLCDACNRGLGFFRDDADVLRRAAAYLEARTPANDNTPHGDLRSVFFGT